MLCKSKEDKDSEKTWVSNRDESEGAVYEISSVANGPVIILAACTVFIKPKVGNNAKKDKWWRRILSRE